MNLSESQRQDVAEETESESRRKPKSKAQRRTPRAGEGELFPANERNELEQKWNEIQARSSMSHEGR